MVQLAMELNWEQSGSTRSQLHKGCGFCRACALGNANLAALLESGLDTNGYNPKNRLDKVKALRWAAGSVIPSKALKDKLSGSEVSFFNRYDKLLGNYMTRCGVDLSADLTPPKNLFVEVRVLASGLGEIQTETGSVNLEQGTTHYLRRADCVTLILQGKLRQTHT
jgi:GINS complex subunit 1